MTRIRDLTLLASGNASASATTFSSSSSTVQYLPSDVDCHRRAFARISEAIALFQRTLEAGKCLLGARCPER